MAKRKKKRSQPGKPKGWLVSQNQVKDWLNQAADQTLQGDYPVVIKTCQRILRYVPAQSQERVEALDRLASAYMMLKQFEEGYQALTSALEIEPNEAYLWYNRGLAGRFTMRLVQAADDLEKAVELETDPEQREKFTELLTQTREMAEQGRAMRGADFTLEQLREQQELFNQGLGAMKEENWNKAEQAFRRVTEMGEDCLPQPYGNLGLALLMQKKYDEAEVALNRALEIDPDYNLARQNLAHLPEVRRSGKTPEFLVTNPMAAAKISLNIQMEDDD